MQQYQSEPEDQEIIVNQYILDMPSVDVDQIVIGAYGPATIYLKTQIKQFTKIGTVKQQSNLIADVLHSQGVLVILFLKDVRYYHFEEYNILESLSLINKSYIEKPFLILTNISAASLESDHQETSLRQLSKGNVKQIALKSIQEPVYEGYFGDIHLYSSRVISLILIQTDYDLSAEQVQYFEIVKEIVPLFNAPVDVKQAVKEFRKSSKKDNIYL